ncbi:MAG: sulfate ABC transporter substrate-binding protein [Clostridium sp.]|nr:sulfate ABC transporter substrate-binding protein [Clostridium sp.]
MRRKTRIAMVAILSIMLSITGCGNRNRNGKLTITNVSYDPTREFYESYNTLFEEYYIDNYGEEVTVIQSHGGSGSQARSVVEGCNADVVTLALEHDITLIERAGLIDKGWIDEFQRSSSPYTSTIVFLVRKGNPKEIKDWDDLTKEGVDVITPDPKSSGGACWNFLAALSYAKTEFPQEEKQLKFMKKLYGNVSVMDSGARGSTTTFVENGKGDVLIAWENEALATLKSYPEEYELVNPSVSILAQPSVAVVDDNAKANKTEIVSQRYLEYLYSDKAQWLIGKYGYRPSDKNILKEFSDTFDLHIDLWSIEDYGGWDQAYQTYFEDGAVFDKIYEY